MNLRNFYPCGLTRREAIWQMGGGFTGLALVDLLSRSRFFTKRIAADDQPISHSTSLPHFPTKVRSVIFLMMNGAPSQVDTFDPKPALEKYAGQEIPKDKKFINSGGRKIGYLTPAFRKFRPGGQSGLL
ncbi:MAG: DUF1501 domain-containing protein, partial [Planctomycetota bacterium]|nr:DUF1501 domain-containing protein [Planctomycetota bacterium]